MRPRKVLFVTSHPIQYQAPLFQALAQDRGVVLKVLFLEIPSADRQGVGFGVPFRWDVPLVEGYAWSLLESGRGPGGFFSHRVADATAVIRDERPDAVIVTGWHKWAMLQFAIAARRLRIPCLVRGEANGLRPVSSPRRWVQRLLLRLFDGYFVIGESARRYYAARGIPPGKLYWAPYFIDAARFTSSARSSRRERAGLRRKWNIPQQALCLCFAGKLEPKKRVLDLLEALRRAARADLHLLIAGAGEQEAAARQFVADHGLAVTFAGFLNQTEIPAAYAASDVLVLPSDFGETWGLVVNEAMACALPAIVSNQVGCSLDLVAEGETGWVYPCGDVVQLARLLGELSAPELARRGERALEHSARYSVRAAVEGILAGVDAQATKRVAT